MSLEETRIYKLEKELRALRLSYSELIKEGRIGKCQSNKNVENTLNINKVNSISLHKQKFNEIVDNNERQAFIIKCNSQQIILSCHNLIDIIYDLKINVILK